MKILVTPTSFKKAENAAARARLEAFADEIVYNETGVPLQGEALLSLLEGVDGYIAGLDYINESVIENAPPSLKCISRYGIGYDRVDLSACTKKGIKVTNTPGANSTAVCELAFTLMLCAARDIPRLHRAVEAGDWPRSAGIELCNKTLGIVGLGTIGKKLAQRALAFDMRVIAYDPYIDKAFAQAHGIQSVELERLLADADVVSLHVPLTEATYHMIDAHSISRMKKGAIIINTARGGLIDEAACASALTSGQLFGLGLDAFEQEPLLSSPLKGLPNVIFTPHTGAQTSEAVSNMGNMAVDNLIAVLEGKNCPYILN